MKKKLLSLLLSLCMIFAMLPLSALAVEGSISYVMWEWRNGGLVRHDMALPVSSVTEVQQYNTEWGVSGQETWYMAYGNITIYTNSIKVNGDVHLILADYCELRVVPSSGDSAAINVAEGNSLTIYGQAGGTGMLTASTYTGSSRGAGIGGNGGAVSGQPGEKCGTVTIHGGTVYAIGNNGGAGIGGGGGRSSDGGDGGIVAIYGGAVIARGYTGGAGIGGGGSAFWGGPSIGNGGSGGIVTIYGGSVTAYGLGNGAGIGGGSDNIDGLGSGSGGTVTICGGSVIATSDMNAAGIGGGNGGDGADVTITGGIVQARAQTSGAGIGGGNGGVGGNVVISGGTVTARSDYAGTGIGGGYGANQGGEIAISGGTVTAIGSGGAAIGGGFDGSAGTIKITGGTIKTYSLIHNGFYGAKTGNGATSSANGEEIVLINDNGDPLLLTEVTLPGLSTATVVDITVSTGFTTYTYGYRGMKTQEGKLYLYLPYYYLYNLEVAVHYDTIIRYRGSVIAGSDNTTLTRLYAINCAPTEGGNVIIKVGEETAAVTEANQNVDTYLDPAIGYELDTIVVSKADGSSVIPVDITATQYVFTMPAEDVTVSVTFKKIAYTITTTPATNGSFDIIVDGILGADETTYGETVTIVTEPDDHYRVSELYIVGSVSGPVAADMQDENTFTFSMPADSVTVSVVFESVPKYTLSVNLNGGDGVTTGGSYAGGAIVHINAGSKDGYVFKEWTSSIGGTFSNANNASTTFIMPPWNVTITATWTAISGNTPGGETPAPDPDPVPTPTPGPAEDTFIFTPSIINEMLEGGQKINIDNGLQLQADLNSIPRNDEDAIIIKASEIRDAGTLSEFYQAYPTLQALYRGYEVNVTVESNNRSTAVTELLEAITLRFRLTTPEELQGIDPSTLVVYKEDDNGVVTELHGTFDWATHTYTVTTDHLCSFYLMAAEAFDEPWINPFTDVKNTDWFYGAVKFVNRYGFYTGTAADRFTPNGTMSRAMFWTVLGRVNGQRLSGSDAFDNARAWATGAGITDGANPDGSITREQMVTILWRYAGSPKAAVDLSKFSDAENVSSFAYDAILWAVENGIILETGDTLIPRDIATRAQAAAVLQRFIESTMK